MSPPSNSALNFSEPPPMSRCQSVETDTSWMATASTCPAQSQIVFSDDFESGNLDQWFGPDRGGVFRDSWAIEKPIIVAPGEAESSAIIRVCLADVVSSVGGRPLRWARGIVVSGLGWAKPEGSPLVLSEFENKLATDDPAPLRIGSDMNHAHR
jgi:hypothetical protein